MSRDHLPSVPRIVFATDFSPASAAAERAAAVYARRLGASLHVLHVVASGEEQVGDLLGDVAGRFGLSGAVVTAVESGDPAARIVDYARRHEADLIVVGTHGRTGVSRVLLGSVAESVLRRAACPVLAVPGGAEDVEAAAEAEVPEEDVEAAAPILHRCLVCTEPSPDLICAACRARIRGEALDRKRREERAGRLER